jgi:RNA polymerase sigma-70 factor (ECF subfamily)
MLSKEKTISIYKSYSKELFLYLRKMAGNADTAEDILHEIFANLIEYSASHDIDESTIRAFLYRSAHNCAINVLRKSGRNSGVEIESLQISSTIDHRSRDQEHLEAQELNNRVYAYLNSIDPKDRSIFILHKELGKTYVQIADELSISERTVRRKMKSMLQKIYDILENDGFL